MPATFTKGERICSMKEIEILVTRGKSLFHYPFKVNYLRVEKDKEGECDAGILISVPKRNFKKAVKRNLLKRRIRESYRLNKQILLPVADKKVHIMFVYVSKQILDYREIEASIKEILNKINPPAL